MADQFVRLDGDYAIYSADGVEYRRWAVGNSLGKKPNTFAERHPRASDAIRAALGVPRSDRPLSHSELGRGMVAVKAQHQAHRLQAAQREAELGLVRAAQAVRPGSAKLPAEAWGLVVERQGSVALGGDAEDSTRAARFVGQTLGYLGGEGSGSPAQAVQVNVTIGGELAGRYSPAEVVDVGPAEPGASFNLPLDLSGVGSEESPSEESPS
jgi:hypothetical protein